MKELYNLTVPFSLTRRKWAREFFRERTMDPFPIWPTVEERGYNDDNDLVSLRDVSKSLKNTSPRFGRCDGRPTSLYVFQLQKGRFHKIGYSHNPKRRAKDILQNIPFGDIEIVAEKRMCCLHHAKIAERAFHIRFLECRKRGEWFLLGKYERNLLLYIFSKKTRRTLLRAS